MNRKTVFIFFLTLFPFFELLAGDIIEEKNKYGGRTELLIPEDTTIREYLKNFYDDTGFMVVQEEKLGSKSLVEVPFFLNRTYYSKDNPTLIIIERYTNPIAYEPLNQRYKDISWFKNGNIIMSIEYYLKNNEYDYKHIIKRKYRPDGSTEEEVLKNE